MKIYKGYAKRDTERNVLVTTDGHNWQSYYLALHLDIENHSPTGFAWGYGGSGPHQLAIALLKNATGSTEIARKYHHDFVRDVISGFDIDKNFELTEDQIKEWLQKKGVTLK